ncbi:MAG: sigma-70 family RNA polymerase sigma factor [Bryobacteraceae bacterium]|nr:sigma-70 family RNA polymerase sigma factor [Bryobacteraceae bacterium]
MAELYDGTSSLVFSLALRVVGNTEDAEEIAADVYSQVWKTAPSYDRSRSSVLGWLVMLTRSRSIDRLRSRAERTRREAVGELPTQIRDPRPVPEEACSFGQRGLLVRRALLTLPGEQRELIELSFFHGLTHSEVAKRKALPLGTVKTRIRLGMLKLRDLLEGIEEAGHES